VDLRLQKNAERASAFVFLKIQYEADFIRFFDFQALEGDAASEAQGLGELDLLGVVGEIPGEIFSPGGVFVRDDQTASLPGRQKPALDAA